MFIPFDVLAVGDRVMLVSPLSTLAGVYTTGHEFTVTGIGPRGPDLVDDNGRRITEAGMIADRFVKIK